jgi:hypothetical protein
MSKFGWRLFEQLCRMLCLVNARDVYASVQQQIEILLSDIIYYLFITTFIFRQFQTEMNQTR